MPVVVGVPTKLPLVMLIPGGGGLFRNSVELEKVMLERQLSGVMVDVMVDGVPFTRA